MNQFKMTVLKASLGGVALMLAAVANAGVVVGWNFQNAAVGQINGIAASTQAAGVTAASFSTGNNGVEAFGSDLVAVTRAFNSSSNTPTLTFTLANALDNVSLSFDHMHNHNPRFPTNPTYKFAVQINNGSGWTNIARDLLASAGTSGSSLSLDLGSGLSAGSYSMRWIGYGYTTGDNSGSEFFALNNVALSSRVPEPASLALVGLALAGVAVTARRKRV